jgi:hypothetical protein
MNQRIPSASTGEFFNTIGAKRPFVDHSIFVVLMPPVKVTAPAIIGLLHVFLEFGYGLTVTGPQ